MEKVRQQDAAANMAGMRAMRERFEVLSHEHPEPGTFWEPLRDSVLEFLKEEDYPREVVLGALDDLRYALRGTDREELEDDVADVMGFMTGYCSPHMRI